jgi:hypothetical protein
LYWFGHFPRTFASRCVLSHLLFWDLLLTLDSSFPAQIEQYSDQLEACSRVQLFWDQYPGEEYLAGMINSTLESHISMEEVRLDSEEWNAFPRFG